MKTVRLSLLVLVLGVAAMAGLAFLLWYYLPRKKVEHTVSVPEEEITIHYEATPPP